MGLFSKPFKDTATGKFLASKGFSTILSAVGLFVPQVAVLNGVKDVLLGTDTTPPNPDFAALSQADKDTFLALHAADLKAAQDEEDAILADKANARAREIAVSTSANVPLFNKIIVPILALIVVVGGGYLYFAIPTERTPIAALVMVVLGYYFGSSLGSSVKNETIANMSKS